MRFPFTKKKRPLKISYSLWVIKYVVDSNILMKKVRINQEHMDYISFQMPKLFKRLEGKFLDLEYETYLKKTHKKADSRNI